jgi:hypothetical protein
MVRLRPFGRWPPNRLRQRRCLVRPRLALHFIRFSAESYLQLRQKRSRRHREISSGSPTDAPETPPDCGNIPARLNGAQPRPGAILGRSMPRRSPWLRCHRSRRPRDRNDGANLLSRHVAEVRREIAVWEGSLSIGRRAWSLAGVEP